MKCSMKDCPKQPYRGCRGYCAAHYKQLSRQGLLERLRSPHGIRKIQRCRADGCSKTIEKGGEGLCTIHYQRMKNHGTLELLNPPMDLATKITIMDLYESGESTYYIGKLLNMDAGKIQYWLIKWGVQRRPVGFQPGHTSPRLKGVKTDGFGYILVHKPDHPNASKGYVREHRLVMERKIGRLLTKNEVVHHINNDPSDNRESNLELTTKGAHTRNHRSALGRLTTQSQRYKLIKLTCDCCGKTYQRKIIKFCRPCRAPTMV